MRALCRLSIHQPTHRVHRAPARYPPPSPWIIIVGELWWRCSSTKGDAGVDRGIGAAVSFHRGMQAKQRYMLLQHCTWNAMCCLFTNWNARSYDQMLCTPRGVPSTSFIALCLLVPAQINACQFQILFCSTKLLLNIFQQSHVWKGLSMTI